MATIEMATEPTIIGVIAMTMFRVSMGVCSSGGGAIYLTTGLIIVTSSTEVRSTSVTV
jgi:hypothetical protein